MSECAAFAALDPSAEAKGKPSCSQDCAELLFPAVLGHTHDAFVSNVECNTYIYTRDASLSLSLPPTLHENDVVVAVVG